MILPTSITIKFYEPKCGMEYIREATVVLKINNSESNSPFVNVIVLFITFVFNCDRYVYDEHTMLKFKRCFYFVFV